MATVIDHLAVDRHPATKDCKEIENISLASPFVEEENGDNTDDLLTPCYYTVVRQL